MSAAATATAARDDVRRLSPKWWVLLITGIAWVLVGIIVLDTDLDSTVAIAFLVGGYLIALGVMEFLLAASAEGWRWLHALLGVLFIIGGVAALTEPFQTFGVLAALLSLFLVVKGAFDGAMALATSFLLFAILIGLVGRMGEGELTSTFVDVPAICWGWR